MRRARGPERPGWKPCVNRSRSGAGSIQTHHRSVRNVAPRHGVHEQNQTEKPLTTYPAGLSARFSVTNGAVAIDGLGTAGTFFGWIARYTTGLDCKLSGQDGLSIRSCLIIFGERSRMRKIVIVLVLAASAAGCTATEQRTAGTALAGAGTGAVIGGLVDGRRGALAGAAIGGGTGAVIGAATAPRECWAHDRWGNPVRDQRGQPVRVAC